MRPQTPRVRARTPEASVGFRGREDDPPQDQQFLVLSGSRTGRSVGVLVGRPAYTRGVIRGVLGRPPPSPFVHPPR